MISLTLRRFPKEKRDTKKRWVKISESIIGVWRIVVPCWLVIPLKIPLANVFIGLSDNSSRFLCYISVLIQFFGIVIRYIHNDELHENIFVLLDRCFFLGEQRFGGSFVGIVIKSV